MDNYGLGGIKKKTTKIMNTKQETVIHGIQQLVKSQ